MSEEVDAQTSFASNSQAAQLLLDAGGMQSLKRSSSKYACVKHPRLCYLQDLSQLCTTDAQARQLAAGLHLTA